MAPSMSHLFLAGRPCAIDNAWGYEPKRFCLHTCTLDHPAALPNYLKAGFVLFKQEAIRREL
jgi:hypothetical protein